MAYRISDGSTNGWIVDGLVAPGTERHGPPKNCQWIIDWAEQNIQISVSFQYVGTWNPQQLQHPLRVVSVYERLVLSRTCSVLKYSVEGHGLWSRKHILCLLKSACLSGWTSEFGNCDETEIFCEGLITSWNDYLELELITCCHWYIWSGPMFSGMHWYPMFHLYTVTCKVVNYLTKTPLTSRNTYMCWFWHQWNSQAAHEKPMGGFLEHFPSTDCH